MRFCNETESFCYVFLFLWRGFYPPVYRIREIIALSEECVREYALFLGSCGGGGANVAAAPREAESKGRQNDNFRLKILILCLQ